jgi:hypothetical protein
MAQSAAALPANLDLYLHVRVLIALILGLSVTRLVSGIAALVAHPGRYRIAELKSGLLDDLCCSLGHPRGID